jgi:hypothetical protein
MTKIRRMTTAFVLAYLDSAGETGATTTEMTLATGVPENYLQRSNSCSMILRRLENRHEARLAGTERSPVYRGAPVHRWVITAAGSKRVRAAAEREATQAGLDALIEQAAGARADALAVVRDEIAELIRCFGMPGVTAEWRAGKIAELRAVPCTLNEIGELFGITRERVRQIELFGAGPVPR